MQNWLQKLGKIRPIHHPDCIVLLNSNKVNIES